MDLAAAAAQPPATDSLTLPPLPPSPVASPSTLAAARQPATLRDSDPLPLHLDPRPAGVPGGLTASLAFRAFGCDYAMDAVFSEGARLASRIAALMVRHAVPDHLEPVLHRQAVRAALDAQDALGSYPLPCFDAPSDEDGDGAEPPTDRVVVPTVDLDRRVADLVTLYGASVNLHHHARATPPTSPTSPTTTLPADDEDDDQESFARAYTRVVHAPVSGLLDAILALQLRYASALHALAARRADDLAHLAALHDRDRKKLPDLAAGHADEVRSAEAIWAANLADLAASQRDEFRFFIRAVALVLARHEGQALDYAALIRAVFDMQRDEAPAPASVKKSRKRGSGPAAHHPAAGAAPGKRTLRKSASSELLRLSHPISDDDDSDSESKQKKAAEAEPARPRRGTMDSEEADGVLVARDSPKQQHQSAGSLAAAEPDSPLATQPPALVERIMEMGFSAEEAEAALLIADGSVERALALLLESPAQVADFLRAQRQAKAAAAASAAASSTKSAARLSAVQKKLSQRLAHQLPSVAAAEPAAGEMPARKRTGSASSLLSTSPSNGGGAPTWSPLKFIQTEVQGVQGKLTGWFSGIRDSPAATAPGYPGSSSSPQLVARDLTPSPTTTTAPATFPLIASHADLPTESFPVLLGTQLKVPFLITLVQLPASATLTAWLAPPTPPPNVATADRTAWGEAIAMRARMAIDLYRTLRVVVVPYPPGTVVGEVEGISPVAAAEALVPELVFAPVKDQVEAAARVLAGPDAESSGNGSGWIAVADTSSAPASSHHGAVVLTRHSNLAAGNLVAHLLPAAESDDASASASASTLHLLRQAITAVRPGDPVDVAVPLTPLLTTGGSASLARRTDAAVKAVRGALLDRARARVFGAATSSSNDTDPAGGASASALAAPEGEAALDGGSVTLVCAGADEWREARRAVVGVFRTG
ncbi:hypothetical protein H9P43_002645 [Blastocladiella emersonii ATCC 22665]|nr:hypothetical protein H9P43_002645 [Blastocladiella emersonii ATCC 22665]